MGLNTNRIIRLMHILRPYGIRGSLCMLGVQVIHIEWDDFVKKANAFDIFLNENMLKELYGHYPINTYAFFKMLGFTEVHAIDASDYEDADIIFNLNNDCDDRWHNKFDLILDGGTLEHVFDIASAMKNLYRMLKPGGIIIHGSPLAGYVDHGFYSISPTFYLDFYDANDYEIIKSEIEFVMDRNQDAHEKWESIYSQDCRLFGNWFDKDNSINEYIHKVTQVQTVRRSVLWLIARKGHQLIEPVYPMQSMWEQFNK